MKRDRTTVRDRAAACVDERFDAAQASTSPSCRQWLRLAATLSLVLFAWGVVLPRLSAVPAVADHVATQQRLDIDPSALFYTELKMSAGVAHRRERSVEDAAAEFWRPGRN